MVTYLHQTRLSRGAYIISNVAVSLCVGPASDDRSRKQPIISKAGRKSIVSPSFCTSTYIDRSNL